jgi:hypothetical protein
VLHETPLEGLASADSSSAGVFPNGLFLVRVQRAQYRWHAQKPFYAIRFEVLELSGLTGHTINGRTMNRARPKDLPIRLNAESYRQLCREVLRRDGWRCQNCGSRENLQIHHNEFAVDPAMVPSRTLLPFVPDVTHRYIDERR